MLDKGLLICYNTVHMVQVTRKDEREANENIIRRFNRKVLQSGVLAEAKTAMRFTKDISKTERRKKAIIRKERKAQKVAKARLGLQ
jgi:ribosomal protein S21